MKKFAAILLVSALSFGLLPGQASGVIDSSRKEQVKLFSHSNIGFNNFSWRESRNEREEDSSAVTESAEGERPLFSSQKVLLNKNYSKAENKNTNRPRGPPF